ncbi:hypothetical protein ACKKBG_A35625 [Auxenochlorella protothecoides x Auxenochlorella symbiontica]
MYQPLPGVAEAPNSTADKPSWSDRASRCLTLTCLVFVIVLGLMAAGGPVATKVTPRRMPNVSPRPDHSDINRLARWLIHEADWGVVSTLSRHLNGAPFGNVVSYADGPRGNSTGRLLFYLTTLDATAYDAQANASAMLTVSEAQLPGSCRGLDAEDPPCAKISILGELHRVPASEEGAARDLLFPRHPAMQDWPAGHEFHMYELFIQQIQLLAWYGGPRQITPQDYFGVQL